MITSFNIDFEKILVQFDSINVKLKRELYNTIQKLGIELTNNIKSSKLTGQALNVKTGRLRNSIHSKTVEENDNIVATISTNVKYAAIHEYGFNGSETIKAHTRRITQVYGKPISPKTIIINSFNRQVNLPERSFMRSALDEMRDKIINELNSAVVRASK